MLNVYAPLLSGKSYIPLLYPNLGREERASILFLNRAFVRLTEKLVEIVDDPAACDCVLLPHNYSSVHRETAYLARVAEAAQKHGKKILVFAHGDMDMEVRLPNAIVYRTSLYRHKRRQNEFAMPAYAEDVLGEEGLMVRPSHDGPPVVGFCGWAAYKNLQNRVGTMVKNAVVEARAVVTGRPEIRSEKKGLSFRMEALRVLQNSTLIKPNFLIRSSYSGHAQTIRMDPEKARSEYRENLLGSDVALVVKGDGNYSYRFYEALSLGRVPVLVDTQCVLPLEEEIRYEECVVRVDFREIGQLDRKIAEWWWGVDAGRFVVMQKRARQIFAEKLRIEAFLERIVRTQRLSA